MKNKKEYSTLELAFLEHLFGPEAQGDIRKAMRLAGYNDTTSTTQVIRQLNEEIIEASKNYIAANAPKALFGTIDVLDKPNQLGASNRIKAANSLLDRAGLVKPEGNSGINVGDIGEGIIILPAKKIAKVEVEEAEEQEE